MIHGDHSVVSGAGSGMEERIGRVRASDLESFLAERRYRRGNHIPIFCAERAAFAGMGVEARDRDSRAAPILIVLANAEIARQGHIDDARGLDDALWRHRRGYCG